MSKDIETIEISDESDDLGNDLVLDSDKKNNGKGGKNLFKKDGSKPFSVSNIKIRYYVIVIVLILIATFMIVNHRHLAPIKFAEWVSDSFARIGSGDGYPYTVTYEDVKSIQAFGKDNCVLTGSSVLILSPSAKVITDRAFSYSSPSLSTAADRILIYEIGGNEFSVQNRSDVLYSGESENAISVAVVGDYGNFAIASKDNVYSSSVKFYSYKFKEEFTWNAGNSYVIDLALSPNGKYGAALTLNAKDGELCSSVYIFNFKNESVLSYETNDKLCTDIFFTDNSSLLLIGDSSFGIIEDLDNKSSVKPLMDYYGNLHLTSYDTEGAAAIVTKLYDNNSIFKINYFNKDDETSFAVNVSEDIRDISATTDYCAILTDSLVRIYDNSGNTVYETLLSDLGIELGAEKILVCKSNIYLFATGQLIQLDYK